MDEKKKKPDSKRSSILKKPTDQEFTDHTVTTVKPKLVRRISFSGKKSIKEFILDDDKNTVWGTSYEESAESHAVANQSGSDGHKVDAIVDPVEMDIETDDKPVVAFQDKENETPETSQWPSINFVKKFPLASSTMISDTHNMDISFDCNLPSVICSDFPAPCDSAVLQFRSPPKRDIIENRGASAIKSPFAWMKDPKIVGKDALLFATSAGMSSLEMDESTHYCPSPMSTSQMNRDTTCNMDISSLHTKEIVSKEKKAKSPKKIAKKSLFAQYPEQENGKKSLGAIPKIPKKLTIVRKSQEPRKSCLKSENSENKGRGNERSVIDDMEITCFKENKESHEDRKTIYFPADHEMNIEEMQNQDRKTYKERRTLYLSQDSMNITHMTDQRFLESVSGKSETPEMDLTLVPDKLSKDSRKTIHVREEMNFTEISIEKSQYTQMDLTLVPDKLPKDSRKTIHVLEEMNITGIPTEKSQHTQMDLTLVPDKLPKDSRKTIHVREEMNLTGISRKSQNIQMDLTLVPDKLPKDSRKTSHVLEEMNLTGISTEKSEHTQMDLTLVTDKLPKDSRKTIHVREKMNLTGISRKSQNIQMDLTLLPPAEDTSVDGVENLKVKPRNTIYFPESNMVDIIEDADGQTVEKSIDMDITNKNSNTAVTRRTKLFNNEDIDEEPLDMTTKSLAPSMKEKIKSFLSFVQKTSNTDMDLCSQQGSLMQSIPNSDDMEVSSNKNPSTTVFSYEDIDEVPLDMTTTSLVPDMKEKLKSVLSERKIPDVTISRMDLCSPQGTAVPSPDRKPEDMDITNKNVVGPCSPRRRTEIFNDEDLVEEALSISGDLLDPELRKKIQSLQDTMVRKSLSQENTVDGMDFFSSAGVFKRRSLTMSYENIDLDNADASPQIQQPVTSLLKRWQDFNSSLQDSLNNSRRMSLEGRTCGEKERNSDTTCENVEEQSQETSNAEISLYQKLLQNDELMKTKLLDEVSLNLTQLTVTDDQSPVNMNLDNTYVQLGDVVTNYMRPPIKQEIKSTDHQLTYTIHSPASSPDQEEVIVIEDSFTSLPDQLGFENDQPMTDNSEFGGPASIDHLSMTSSRKDVAIDEIAKIENMSTDVPLSKLSERDLTRTSIHWTMSNDCGCTADALPKNILDKLEKYRSIKGEVQALKESLYDVFNSVEECMKTFVTTPNRCALPEALTFDELLKNMVECTFPNVWYVNKFINSGSIIFKHRKITTFIIKIRFDPEDHREIENVNSRGTLFFRSLQILDCDWYTDRNPARRSPLWVYLHTHFRRRVLSDAFLRDLYINSSQIRDFLQYIDNICCEIYANCPSLIDLIRGTY
ncbi:hypothetical protein DMENIID0001_044690 [Sergentomyia squamirostris]